MTQYHDISLPDSPAEARRAAEAALFRACVGYEWQEVKEEENEKGAKRTVTTKHQAPSVSALTLYLRHVWPEKYGDAPAPDTVRVAFENLPDSWSQ